MIHKIKGQFAQGKEFIFFSFLKMSGQGLEMLTPLILASFVTPEFFGKYSLAKMIIFFFSALFISSSSTPFIINASKEKQTSGKINQALSIQFVIISLSIFFFAAITLIFSKQLRLFADLSKTELLILLPAFIGITIKIFSENFFLALDKKIKNSLIGIFYGIIILFLTVGLFFFHSLTFFSVFVVYFFAGIFLLLFMHKTLRREISYRFKLSKKFSKKFLSFTAWQALGLTAVYFINWGDNLFLRYFVSLEEIGIYNLGYQIFKGLITASFIISTYFLPFVSQNINNKEKIKKYLTEKRPPIIIAGILIIVICYFTITPIFDFFYGEKYARAAIVLKILLIPATFHLLTVFYIPIVNALEKYKFSQITNIATILINVVLNIFLIKKFGIMGAAISTTVAYTFSFLSYLIFIKRLKLTKQT